MNRPMYEVEKITGIHIAEDNLTYYQVQWAPSWEPVESLQGCEELIRSFWMQQSSMGIIGASGGGSVAMIKQEPISIEDVTQNIASCQKKRKRSTLSSSNDSVENNIVIDDEGTQFGSQDTFFLSEKVLRDKNAAKQSSLRINNDGKLRKISPMSRKSINDSVLNKQFNKTQSFGMIAKKRVVNSCVYENESLDSSDNDTEQIESSDANTSQEEEMPDESYNVYTERNMPSSAKDDTPLTQNQLSEKVFGSTQEKDFEITASYSFADQISKIHKEFMSFASTEISGKASNPSIEISGKASNPSIEISGKASNSSTEMGNKVLNASEEVSESLSHNEVVPEETEEFIITNVTGQVNLNKSEKGQNEDDVKEESPAQSKGDINTDIETRSSSDVEINVQLPAGSVRSLRDRSCVSYTHLFSSPSSMALKPFRCFTCFNGYTSKHMLRNHCLTRHKQIMDRSQIFIKCNICKKRFNKAVKLKQHLKTHPNRNGSFYKCALCFQIFSNIYSMENHVMAHEFNLHEVVDTGSVDVHEVADVASLDADNNDPAKVNSLDECVSVEDTASSVATNTEKSDRDVAGTTYCNKCYLSFETPEELDRHNTLLHSVMSPLSKEYFKCPVCPCKFSNNKSRGLIRLNRHMLQKHPNLKTVPMGSTLSRLIKCPICVKHFARLPHLHKHLRISHSIPSKEVDIMVKTCFPEASNSIEGTLQPNETTRFNNVSSANLSVTNKVDNSLHTKTKSPFPVAKSRGRPATLKDVPKKAVIGVIKSLANKNRAQSTFTKKNWTVKRTASNWKYARRINCKDTKKISSDSPGSHNTSSISIDSKGYVSDDNDLYYVRPHQCPHCKVVVKGRNGVIQHVVRHLRRCDQLNMVPLQSGQGRDMSAVQTTDYAHVCPFCMLGYASNKALVRHIKFHHANESTDEFKTFMSCNPKSTVVEIDSQNDNIGNQEDDIQSTTEQSSSCGNSFRYRSWLERHKKDKHSLVVKKEANVIKKEQLSKNEKVGNVEEEVSRIKIYNCKYCDKTFMHRNSVYPHVNTKHQEQKLEDALARQAASSRRKTNNLKYNCPICSVKFEKLIKLTTHIRTSHKKLRIGDALQLKKESVNESVTEDKTTTPVHPIVKRTVGRPKKVNKHVKLLAKLSSGNAPKLPGGNTAKLAGNMGKLTGNTVKFPVGKVKKSTVYPCKFCGKKLPSSTGVSNHMRNCGPAKNIENKKLRQSLKDDDIFKCNKCDARFNDLKSKHLHSRIHRSDYKEDGFKCDHCPSSFNWRCNLRKHARVSHNATF